MSLASAIKETMDGRGLRTADVARRLGREYDRATFYRVLGGITTEPRLATLLGLCQVLDISPTELLQRAGLWPRGERAADDLDVRLREAFAQIQELPLEDKRQAVHVIARMAAALISWDHTLAPEEGRTAS